MGKPSKRTDAVVKRIVDGISDGIPLAVLCRDDAMPATRTVREWAQNDDALSAVIAGAREDGHDVIAWDVITIADDATEDPASRRVRVEARLKLLAKWDPKRYGDKVQLNGAGEQGEHLIKAVEWNVPEVQRLTGDMRR